MNEQSFLQQLSLQDKFYDDSSTNRKNNKINYNLIC